MEGNSRWSVANMPLYITEAPVNAELDALKTQECYLLTLIVLTYMPTQNSENECFQQVMLNDITMMMGLVVCSTYARFVWNFIGDFLCFKLF